MTHKSLSRCLACVLIALFTPSMVAAQGAPPLFVDGAVFGGIENFSNSEITQGVARSNDLSGTVVGGTFAVGTFLGPRASLRVEASFPTSTHNEFTETSTNTGSPVPPPTFNSRDEQTMQSFSILGGYHLANRGRIRMSYLAGASFLRVHQNSIQSIHYPAFPPLQAEHTQETSFEAFSYIPAVVFGLDAEIRAGSHVSIVPGARILGTAGAMSLRPGVALRWAR